MTAAKKKPETKEPSATFTLGDVSVTVPVETQGSPERTEQVVRQALHRLADFGSVELHDAE